MPISAKRKLVAGAAGLAVLAGSGGAYAAGQSGTPAIKHQPADRAAEQKAFLDDVAKRLSVTRDQLDAALKGAAEARIDAAVAAGKLTKEQGDAAKQRLASGAPLLPGLGPIIGGRGPKAPGGHGFGPGRGGHRLGFGGAAGAADYLGISEAQLREQLRDGKSLADIAKATNGKTVEGLKAAIKAKFTERLDEAVKNGRITQAQRDKVAADLDERIDEIVTLTPPDRPERPKFRWR
jgi:polyhydroxyalkanoate synthesis regulator phasin